MATGIRIGLDEVVCHFAELEDPRSEINRRHPLVSVVVIAIMAVLAGASGPTGIAKWARFKEDLLKGLLPLPNGVPRKDVFRRVLATLKPQVFQACFANWLQSMRDKAAADTEIEKPVIPIDGKTLRRSHDKRKGLGALHSVSAWASDFGLSLGQVATDAKSNEITAIPELLRLIDIRGAIITIDAMGTQTAIAAQIIDGGGDYLLALKGNQESLHDSVIEFVDKQMETNFSDCGARQHITEETGHGREETRHYIQMPAPKTLAGFSRWKGLLTIGVAILHCIRDGKQTVDIRYYISSLPMGVKQFAHAVRAHWGIENTLHWTLDVTYREDESRIRNEHLRENFAWLNRFTLSLLKQHPGKDSVAMKRRSCGWNDEALVETLTGIMT
ncbi:MAG: ISAs1 family transposase [Acidobacteriota bacterium]|nr:ISAs1 family transposase [Acidobacteriota bacterium]